MAVKLADTLAPMGDFEIAKASDINVTIDGTEKRLQTAIDNGEIGGGDSSFTGTQAEWEALLPTEKAKYTTVYFTDDTDDALIDDATAHNNKVYSSNKIATDYPFKFGIDADGNYGYIKVGADSVTPFKRGVEDTGKIYGRNSRMKLMKCDKLRFMDDRATYGIETGIQDIVLDEEDRPSTNTTVITIFTNNAKEWVSGTATIGTNGKITFSDSYSGYYCVIRTLMWYTN